MVMLPELFPVTSPSALFYKDFRHFGHLILKAELAGINPAPTTLGTLGTLGNFVNQIGR